MERYIPTSELGGAEETRTMKNEKMRMREVLLLFNIVDSANSEL